MVVKKKVIKRKPTKAKVTSKVSTQTKVSLVVAMALAAFIGHSFALMSFKAIESFGPKKIEQKSVVTQSRNTSTLSYSYEIISDHIIVDGPITIEDIDTTHPGKELIFIGSDYNQQIYNNLYVIYSDDGGVVPGFPKPLGYGDDNYSPIVADIDKDGDMEIFVTSQEGAVSVYAFNNDGSVYNGNVDFFLSNDQYLSFDTISLININDTPELEIITLSSNNNNGRIFIYDYLGEELDNISIPGNVSKHYVVTDIDKDGGVDIVFASWNDVWSIYAYDLLTNEEKWNFGLGNDIYMDLMAIGNVYPGNNQLEIVFMKKENYAKDSIVVLDSNGQVIDSAGRIFYSDNSHFYNVEFSLADIVSYNTDDYQGERVQEIIVEIDGNVYAIGAWGEDIEGWEDPYYIDHSDSQRTVPIIANIDDNMVGEGSQEIMVGIGRIFKIYSTYMHEIASITTNGSIHRYEAIAIDDIDNDGRLEVVLGGTFGVQVVSFDVDVSGKIEWGKDSKDNRNTSDYYSQCSDGTYINECGMSQPQYCVINPNSNITNYVKFINNCQVCGCAGNLVCEADGRCVKISELPNIMIQ